MITSHPRQRTHLDRSTARLHICRPRPRPNPEVSQNRHRPRRRHRNRPRNRFHTPAHDHIRSRAVRLQQNRTRTIRRNRRRNRPNPIPQNQTPRHRPHNNRSVPIRRSDPPVLRRRAKRNFPANRSVPLHPPNRNRERPYLQIVRLQNINTTRTRPGVQNRHPRFNRIRPRSQRPDSHARNHTEIPRRHVHRIDAIVRYRPRQSHDPHIPRRRNLAQRNIHRRPQMNRSASTADRTPLRHRDRPARSLHLNAASPPIRDPHARSQCHRTARHQTRRAQFQAHIRIHQKIGIRPARLQQNIHAR